MGSRKILRSNIILRNNGREKQDTLYFLWQGGVNHSSYYRSLSRANGCKKVKNCFEPTWV